MMQMDRNTLLNLAPNLGKVNADLFADLEDVGLRVHHPRAQVVLTRAFTRVFQEGGKPQLLRLAKADARLFPQPSEVSPFCWPVWLAVGIGVAGNPGYLVQAVLPNPDLTKANQRRGVETIMFKALSKLISDAASGVHTLERETGK